MSATSKESRDFRKTREKGRKTKGWGERHNMEEKNNFERSTWKVVQGGIAFKISRINASGDTSVEGSTNLFSGGGGGNGYPPPAKLKINCISGISGLQKTSR